MLRHTGFQVPSVDDSSPGLRWPSPARVAHADGQRTPREEAITEHPSQPPWRRAITIVLFVGLAVIVVLGTMISWLWPRDDTPRQPDAILVLGGLGAERAALGIELRDRYDADLILSSSASHLGEQQGVVCGDDALCVEPEPGTTLGEAQMVHDLAQEHGWEHVTVATSRFHTTRARVLFRQCLDNRVTVVGALPPSGEDRSMGVYLREAGATIVSATVQRACSYR